MRVGTCAVCAVVMGVSGSAMGTDLTFTIDGIGNFGNIPQDYGDRVTMLDEGSFHYGEHGEGFTPNVEVSYTTSAGQDPSWWGTGYGDLVGIYFENTDGNGSGEIVLTADFGYEVVLYGFDMSAYGPVFSGDPVIDAVRVRGCSSAPLFEELDASISETTRTSYDFSTEPIRAREIRIQFESGNLGGLSDDIAIDNIVFGQVAVSGEEIACPADFAIPVCVLDFFDISEFLMRLTAQDPSADFSGDGQFDFFDISAFLSAYEQGCQED